jgi:hypothetical protein
MSIIRVSELSQTTGVTANSLFLTSYGESNPRQSKYITKQDLLGQYATTGSNTFYGNQTITGSFNVSGSTLQVGNNGLVGNTSLSGSVGITGSLTISEIPQGAFTDSALVVNPTTHVVSYVTQNIRTVYGLFTQTADSTMVSGTTTESQIIGSGVGSLTVPANGFSVGDSFKADLGGLISTANNETIRIRVKAADTGMLLADSDIQTVSNVSNNVFTLSLNFIIRQIGGAGVASIVSIGRFSYNKTVNGAIEGFSFNTVNNTTFDTTGQVTLSVTIQFGSNSANNKIYSDIFTLNKIY